MNYRNWKTAITAFLTAQMISLLGSSLVQYAIIWHITLTTSSGKMLTISTLCGFLPQILISLIAGVWIDRYNRKKLIMLALFIVLAIRSAGTGIQTPAVNAIIPQIVPQEKLMKINGINSTLSSLIMFLSPAISGAILTVASLEVTLFIDVITAAIGISITAAIYIRPYERTERREGSSLKEIGMGFSYLNKNHFIRKLLVYQVIILFLISPSAFLTPLMVSRTFGTEVWRLTASEMTYSLGMILGGLLITAWGGFSKKVNTTMAAGALYGVLMIGLGNAPQFLIYLSCNTLIGITAPCYNGPITVTIQEKVEPQMQGRVFSFMQIATSCALPLGMVIFGPLADMISIRILLTLAGAFVVSVSAAVWGLKYFNK